MARETASVSATAFNPAIVKRLLLGIRISDESGELLGVPTGLLEQWLRQLAVQLEGSFHTASTQGDAYAAFCGKRLSAEEIRFLLCDCDETVPEHA